MFGSQVYILLLKTRMKVLHWCPFLLIATVYCWSPFGWSRHCQCLPAHHSCLGHCPCCSHLHREVPFPSPCKNTLTNVRCMWSGLRYYPLLTALFPDSLVDQATWYSHGNRLVVALIPHFELWHCWVMTVGINAATVQSCLLYYFVQKGHGSWVTFFFINGCVHL